MILVVLVLVALAGLAIARPGGGNSFSGGGGHSSSGGGGSHSSGGGGGGGGGGAIFELIFQLIRLLFYFPQIGVPILLIVIAWFAWSAWKQHQNKDWDSGPPVQLKRAVSANEIKRLDPEFSQVLFEDFAFRLFSTAQRARSSPELLATVAPYVSAAARQQLLQRTPGQIVQSAIVGAMRIYRVEVPPAPVDENGLPTRVTIGVEYEANVTTDAHTWYTVETWIFARDAGRLSKPPGRSKEFPCPNCGAPWQSSQTGTQKCASCGEIVDNGRFDWIVDRIMMSSSQERPPTVTEDVPERGTDLATYRAADVDARWMELEQDDPAITEQNLVARLNLIYRELNQGWSNNDLRGVRGLVSDGLFDYLQYWVDTYKKQGYRNQLTDMGITHTIVAKVARDKWYDAVTIRLWATGKDFVVKTATGELVRGSKHTPRPYSEYWTLIRSRSRRGAPVATPNCSNCGAPLQITMAGECEHCHTHITSGEFDWVLSKIEQDDTYRG